MDKLPSHLVLELPEFQGQPCPKVQRGRVQVYLCYLYLDEKNGEQEWCKCMIAASSPEQAEEFGRDGLLLRTWPPAPLPFPINLADYEAEPVVFIPILNPEGKALAFYNAWVAHATQGKDHFNSDVAVAERLELAKEAGIA